MRLFYDFLQTNLIVDVSPGYKNEIGTAAARYLIQTRFKEFTNHLAGPCPSCIVCKYRTILQHNYFKAQHPSNLNDRNGNMTSAADNQTVCLLYPSRCV